MNARLNGFFSELRRRKVYRVAGGYAVVGWLLIQIAATVFPPLDLPAWSLRLVILAVLAGFPISLVLEFCRWTGANKRTRRAELWLRKRNQISSSRSLNPMAHIYAALGRVEETLPLLARLLEMPSGIIADSLRYDPTCDFLRDDPRFQALLVKHGVAT